MTSRTRATLLEHLRDGNDPLAWEEFFSRYGRLIFTAASRRGCSDHTAEEIVQEVLATVFRHKDLFHYDPQRGRFRDWLGAIVRNQVASYRRRPAQRLRAVGGSSAQALAEVEEECPQVDALWETTFEEGLLGVLLDILRREMNPRDYLAFELLTLEELSGAEVARLTGLTRNAAYKARRRALHRLRELGQPYRDEGHLGGRLKQVLQGLPDAAAERSRVTRLGQALPRRQEPGSRE